MIPQGNAQDLTDFGEMIVEGEDLFEEVVTILRAGTQSSTPGPMGNAVKPSTTQIAATAVIVEMNVAAKMLAAGVFSAGDLVIEIRDRLLESSENIGGTQQADKILYRGMEYRMVGRPIPQALGKTKSGDVPFYIVHLRRTNSTTDTVGA